MLYNRATDFLRNNFFPTHDAMPDHQLLAGAMLGINMVFEFASLSLSHTKTTGTIAMVDLPIFFLVLLSKKFPAGLYYTR
jgi:hypothetical protein